MPEKRDQHDALDRAAERDEVLKRMLKVKPKPHDHSVKSRKEVRANLVKVTTKGGT